MNNRNWIIIDTRTNKALCGVERKTLWFSSFDIAQEVGMQFFKSDEDWTVFDLSSVDR